MACDPPRLHERPKGSQPTTKHLARARRRAQRLGGLKVVAASTEELGPLLDTIYRLHAARWRPRGVAGVLAEPAIRSLHRAALGPLHARGLVRLLELRLAGRPIASLLAFVRGRRWLCYISGFDPELAALSPGHLLLAELIERALAEGAEEVDLLRGVEPYKYDWGARDRVSQRLTLPPT
jgi:CelD/BcsL family acetyltransferase involved in cellulose biosynthesis